MMNKGVLFAVFSLGAAVGSAITWRLLKDKYEQIAQEEIEAVREVYSKSEEERKNKLDEVSKKIFNKPWEEVSSTESKEELTHMIQQYSNYTGLYTDEKKTVDDVEKPYVIEPDEFGELDDYETIFLDYYQDGVLADDRYNIIEYPDEIIGLESLNHIGDYEPNIVHVRNDRLQCDYEVSVDLRKYSDVVEVE